MANRDRLFGWGHSRSTSVAYQSESDRDKSQTSVLPRPEVVVQVNVKASKLSTLKQYIHSKKMLDRKVLVPA